MTRKLTRKQWQKLKKRKFRDESLSTKNIAGKTDYTPYNAITGSDAMSSGRVTNPVTKLKSGFNTVKK